MCLFSKGVRVRDGYNQLLVVGKRPLPVLVVGEALEVFCMTFAPRPRKMNFRQYIMISFRTGQFVGIAYHSVPGLPWTPALETDLAEHPSRGQRWDPEYWPMTIAMVILIPGLRRGWFIGFTGSVIGCIGSAERSKSSYSPAKTFLLPGPLLN